MLWRAYALLSHGGDRIGLAPRGPASWPRQSAATADDVLGTLNRSTTNDLDREALCGLRREGPASASSRHPCDRRRACRPPLRACADPGRLHRLLASLGFVTWERRTRSGRASAHALSRPRAERETFRAALRAPLLQSGGFPAPMPRGTRSTCDGWTSHGRKPSSKRRAR